MTVPNKQANKRKITIKKEERNADGGREKSQVRRVFLRFIMQTKKIFFGNFHRVGNRSKRSEKKS